MDSLSDLFGMVVQLLRPLWVTGILRHVSELEFRQEISERMLNLDAQFFDAFLHGADIFGLPAIMLIVAEDHIGMYTTSYLTSWDRCRRLHAIQRY
jgi:hypothetical protein